MHPASGGKFDFENDDYASLYQNLLDNSGIMRDNGSNDINMLVKIIYLIFNSTFIVINFFFHTLRTSKTLRHYMP